MDVSIITPAYSEEENVRKLVSEIVVAFEEDDATREFEIVLVVNDEDPSDTPAIADALADELPAVTPVHRQGNGGFGNAIKTGLAAAEGDILVPIMSDFSDDPRHALRLVEAVESGNDIAYGSRFAPGGSVEGYPPLKLVLNRLTNNTAKVAFGIDSEDVTNIFTAYRAEVIDDVGVENLESESFDITIELPIRAHMNARTYTEVPVSFRGRDEGESSFRILREGPLFAERFARLFWQYRVPSNGRIEPANRSKNRT
ncbi:glycosyltransferase family 2 protein [Haloprofundus salilacus]|uniref:glycosyltransferase family 2 protein n=1 Tax=Haloprofundus salilacus TaxID=2876190 RepID=UPI001CCD86DD|nr:glycosyltransferase family 2 protein [Haloprofundus salilacus]